MSIGTVSLPAAVLALLLAPSGLVPPVAAVTIDAAGGARPRADTAQVAVSVLVAAATPDRVDLVWRFRPADRWYLYAPYRNDTGFPPSVTFDLPEGWVAGPLEFPAPARKVLPGEILDHVYPSELLVTQTLHTGGRAAPGGKVSANLFWLACKDLCVPGQAVLEVPVGEPDPAAGELWERARLARPLPLPQDAVTIARDQAAIRLTVPGAARLVFIPAEDGPVLENLLQDGAAEAETLRLRLRPTDAATEPLAGLLMVSYQDGRSITGTILIP
jgi:DsbC/DsbD-like thiol-disulfide interchange protein